MYTPPHPPMQHQLEARAMARGRSGFAYLMEMGTGKTKTCLDEFGEAYEAGEVDCLVVVAPKGVHSNWYHPQNADCEVLKHLPASLTASAIMECWSSGNVARIQEQERRLLALTPGMRVWTVNVEALATAARCMDLLRAILKRWRCMMVIDESIVMANPQAKRTKAILSVKHLPVYNRILSGQPINKAPTDLYAQFEFLGPALLGHRSFYSYRAEFCVMRDVQVGARTVKTVVGSKNLERLARLVAQHSYRKRKDECLDLPPKVWQRRAVELSDEQRRVYKKMRDEAWVALSEGEATTTAVITQLLRLHQIACGHITDDDGRVHELGNGRVDALLELCEEVDGSAIVWCNYRHDIEKVARALRKVYGADSVVEYHGGVADEERERAKQSFQAGEARWFVANQQTAGRGLTLTRAKTAIYYSNNYDLEQRNQSEDRCHRIGQTGESVLYVDLYTPGTVDETIQKALRAKMDVVSIVLKDGYRDWLI